MEEMAITQAWDYLLEMSIATQEELELITSINGYNLESLNDVMYARTGEYLPKDGEEEEY